MKKFQQLAILLLPVLFSVTSSCGQFPVKNNNSNKPAAQQPLVSNTTEQRQFDGGNISIPSGWSFIQTGSCSDKAFVAWDPSHPEREFFCLGYGGLFYLSQQQRNFDNNYIRMGGMRTPLTGKPVIYPATAANYVQNFSLLAEYPDVRQALQKIPELYNVQIISVTPQTPGINAPTANTALVRAVFTDRNRTKASEGLFLVTVVSMQITSYGPSASFGFAVSFMGITAPLNELDAMMGPLSKCMQTFYLSQEYVTGCMQRSTQQAIESLKAGRALSEASDNMFKSWQNKSKSDDIISQQRSDATMGRMRLYDPSTKTVYNVDNNFIDTYKSDPSKFNMSNLQQIPPGDHSLWTTPTVNGADHIVRIR